MQTTSVIPTSTSTMPTTSVMPTSTVESTSVMPTSTSTMQTTSVMPTSTSTMQTTSVMPTSTSTMQTTSVMQTSTSTMQTTSVMPTSTSSVQTTSVTQTSSSVVPTSSSTMQTTSITPTSTVETTSTIQTSTSSFTPTSSSTVETTSISPPTSTSSVMTTTIVSTSTISPTSSSTVTPTSSVTPTTPTTQAPTTDSGARFKIRGSLRITAGAVWNESLGNQETQDYKNLLADFENEMDFVLMNNAALRSRYKGLEDVSFSEGSVIVNYTLLFSVNENIPISSDYVTSVIRAAAVNSSSTSFQDFKVDPNSITNSVVIVPTTPTASTPTTPPTTIPESTTMTPEVMKALPNWAIAVIACGAAVLLFLLSLICVLCRRRHVTHKYALEDPDDINYTRTWAKDTSQNNMTYAYDNQVDVSDVAESGQVKAPVPHYNLTDRDVREGNGTATGVSRENRTADPNKVTVL
ncbi:hypothetical protein MAR_003485 [Mya arenaria]|uniref:SEA domain-containing protein n=1 Tax=Mya arenaria TaxID=6604 RepID=A0ABY7G652_MYAAR|nr:hypothetical protein MAR_003485 [Mya arenaria]